LLPRRSIHLLAPTGVVQTGTQSLAPVLQEFTNQLFQLANPLAAAKPVCFNSGSDSPGYCRLDDKYVQNLLSKCQEQGGSLTAYPSIAS
jgi:hypothetical protein